MNSTNVANVINMIMKLEKTIFEPNLIYVHSLIKPLYLLLAHLNACSLERLSDHH
jgi:hypothetical protein